MAREQVILAGLLLAACDKPLPYEGAFQLPQAAAVLQPEVGGPFTEPVGFVANGHGGEIIQLALKQGRYLTDDETVPFLRTNPLATGGLRRLGAVAVVAPSVGEVTVWAGDQAYGTLLKVPYLYDCDATPDRPECAGAPPGAPVEQAAYWSLVQTPGTAQIADIGVKKGYSTTELWTITYDGSEWTVEGSRSGRQEPATTGVWYDGADLHRVSFTITDPDHAAQSGDTFLLRTESGLSEHDVGGTPLQLQTTPDQKLLAVIVQERRDNRPHLRWFDPAAMAITGDVTLAADSAPSRLSWSEDGMLLVSDREHPAVWEVAPGETTALEHPMPWPTLDVTALDGEDRRRLYVVPQDGRSLWVYDRDVDEPIDVNPALEGDQGIEFTANITGIEALRLPYWMPEYTDDAIRITGRAVAVVLTNSRVVFAHEETGCLVQDNLGPRTDQANQSYAGLSDVSATYLGSYPYAAQLELEGKSGRHVSVNACAGVAHAEGWTVTYDGNVQAWRVHGALAGDQVGLAYEDQRYLSDGGEISFMIRSGTTPSRDGWQIGFSVNAGTAIANGDTNGDGVIDLSLAQGAEPVYFDYRAGLSGPIGDHQGSGWYPVDLRPFVLVPGASTDTVGRIDPQNAQIEVGWN